MALATATAKNTLATAYAAAAKFATLYSTVPGATPGTEVGGGSYARVPVQWSTAVAGTVTATVTFNVPSGTTVRGAGLHTDATVGYFDGWTVAEQGFSSDGKYTLSITYTAA